MTFGINASAGPLAPGYPGYRRDIDGLRAIAVLSVIAFHTFPQWITGGFVGVDIFFVISGYVISRVIFNQLDSASFSFAGFYGRRIRRIFPALICVLVASYLIGWFLLLAREYQQLGKHTAAGAGFAANFLLWGEAGYFDTAAETKPLMHLWSLGIEEQFYIVWPLLLWIAWKRKFNFLAMMAGIGVASFAVNLLTVDSNSTAAFYSPLSRFWELMAGGALAYTNQYRPGAFARANLQSIAGMILIVAGLVLLNKYESFPGWWAICPVAGSFLVIAAGPAAWVNRNVLGNRVLVWIGLISYPLYLWHWPLLTFARIFGSHMPDASQMPPIELRIAVVLLSFALAWLTFEFVEKPFRFGKIRKRAVLVLCVQMTVVAAIGGVTYFREGLVFNKQLTAMDVVTDATSDWTYPSSGFDGGAIKTSSRQGQSASEVIFLGDSHMEHYWPRVDYLYKTRRPLLGAVFATYDGCAPVPSLSRTPGAPAVCGDVYAAALRMAKNPQVTKVVFSGVWEGNAQVSDTALETLARDIKELVGEGKKVYIVLSSPVDNAFRPYSMYALQSRQQWIFDKREIVLPREVSIDVEPLRKKSAAMTGKMRSIALRSGAHTIDPFEYLCSKTACTVVADGKPVYVDRDHMRPFFAIERATFIDEIIGAN